MGKHRRVGVIVWLLALLASVAARADLQPALEGALLLHGFGFEWNRTPHRISRLGADLLDPMAVPSPEPALEGEGRAILRPGSWGWVDQAECRLGYGGAIDPRLSLRHGTTALRRLEGSYLPGWDRPAEESFVASFDLAAAGLGGAEHFEVVLRGFHFSTETTHPEGFTLRRLAVRLGPPTRRGDRLEFPVLVSLGAGPVPDRIQRLWAYEVEARVGYVVIAGDAGLHVTRGRHGYRLAYPAGLFDPPRPHADPELQAVLLQGAPGLPSGLIGLQGFAFELNADDDSTHSGRYVRELGLELLDPTYDPASGAATLRLDGYLSNAGLIAYDLTVDVDAWISLLQVGPGLRGMAQERFVGPHTVPCTSWPIHLGFDD